MTVAFISALGSGPGGQFDPGEARRYARALDNGGFDHTLIGYSSSSPDVLQLAQLVAGATERIKPIVAHRPGVTFPTHAARGLATLDRIARGRLAVHIISGGDTEQRREGDYLTKAQRYERSAEYITILRRAWASPEPFSSDGPYFTFTFEGFHSGVLPYQELIPVPGGGSSDEPLPRNTGSRRLLDVAARGERHDRAPWIPIVTATNAAGSSTALVGSYETVAAALLDYVDIGCELLSIRGFDPLGDAIGYGRHVLPLVRQALARRAPVPA